VKDIPGIKVFPFSLFIYLFIIYDVRDVKLKLQFTEMKIILSAGLCFFQFKSSENKDANINYSFI